MGDAADIIYIPNWASLLYLAVVLDFFSRRPVSRPMENCLRTELVLQARDLALGPRQA